MYNSRAMIVSGGARKGSNLAGMKWRRGILLAEIEIIYFTQIISANIYPFWRGSPTGCSTLHKAWHSGKIEYGLGSICSREKSSDPLC
jgi:hypothetical protein